MSTFPNRYCYVKNKDAEKGLANVLIWDEKHHEYCIRCGLSGCVYTLGVLKIELPPIYLNSCKFWEDCSMKCCLLQTQQDI